MLDSEAALALIPYLLAASAYALKLTLSTLRDLRQKVPAGARHDHRRDRHDLHPVPGLAAGWDHLLLSCIFYAPGAILYVIAWREREPAVCPPAVLFGVIVAPGAIAGIYG